MEQEIPLQKRTIADEERHEEEAEDVKSYRLHERERIRALILGKRPDFFELFKTGISYQMLCLMFKGSQLNWLLAQPELPIKFNISELQGFLKMPISHRLLIRNARIDAIDEELLTPTKRQKLTGELLEEHKRKEIALLDIMGELRNLEILFLQASEYGPDDFLRFLEGLLELRHLDLPCHMFKNEGLKCLLGMKELCYLNLAETTIDDEGMQFVGQLSKLEDLDLCGAAITDRGLQYLEGLDSLREINLFDCEKISCQGMKSLAKLKGLKALWLGHVSVEAVGFRALAASESLEQLELKIEQINSEEVLESLTKMKALKTISIDDSRGVSKLDDENIFAKCQERLPGVEVIWV